MTLPRSRSFAAAMAVAVLALALAAPATAAPRVVADIAPVHSVVARVLEGVAAPALLLPSGATPHGYALRPSEAAALEAADIVFWVGAAYTPWLAEPLATLAPDARRVSLQDADGLTLLPLRAGGPFEADPHDHGEAHGGGHQDGEAHDHAVMPAHDPEQHAEHHTEHATGTDHHGDHRDHRAHHDDHGDEAGPAHAPDGGADTGAGIDGHLWLDPLNGAAIAEAVAAALSEADPANAATYEANAAALVAELAVLTEEVTERLAPVRDRAFIVFHDAYQYFESRFEMPAAGSVALHDGDQPGPGRMAEIRARVRESGIVCAFAEPQFDAALMETALEGTDARRGSLDPISAGLEPGPDLYPALIRTLGDDLVACLDG